MKWLNWKELDFIQFILQAHQPKKSHHCDETTRKNEANVLVLLTIWKIITKLPTHLKFFLGWTASNKMSTNLIQKMEQLHATLGLALSLEIKTDNSSLDSQRTLGWQ